MDGCVTTQQKLSPKFKAIVCTIACLVALIAFLLGVVVFAPMKVVIMCIIMIGAFAGLAIALHNLFILTFTKN